MSDALQAFNEAAPAPKKVDAEKRLRQIWIHTLSAAMLKSGKGFRMDSPKRRPPQGGARWRGERRADKVGTTKLSRRLMSGVA
jgi:hypothetical protein